MNIDNIVKEIEKKGYYILKNYMSKDFCNDIMNTINKQKLPYNKGEGNDLRISRFEIYSNNATKLFRR